LGLGAFFAILKEASKVFTGPAGTGAFLSTKRKRSLARPVGGRETLLFALFLI
jgi:hypothetical protein